MILLILEIKIEVIVCRTSITTSLCLRLFISICLKCAVLTFANILFRSTTFLEHDSNAHIDEDPENLRHKCMLVNEIIKLFQIGIIFVLFFL